MNMTKMLCNDVSGHFHDIYISCIMLINKLRQKTKKAIYQLADAQVVHLVLRIEQAIEPLRKLRS